MGLRTLIRDLAKDAWDVAKKGANVAGDVTGVKQFSSGISDAIVTRQMQPEIEARNQRARDLDNKIMQQAAEARKKGDKAKATKLLKLASSPGGQIDIEKDVLGHSFDDSIKNTKVGAAKLAATVASMGVDAVPVATTALAKVAPGAAKVVQASPTARLAFASGIRGLENAVTQAPIDLAEGGVEQAKKNFGTNVAFGAAANTILSPRLVLKSGKEVVGAGKKAAAKAGEYEVGLMTPKPGTVQLNSGLPLEIRKKGQKAADNIIEEADKLAAIHTTSAENIKRVVDAGGFPAPSIAVKKNPAEFEDFGQIQLIFGKDTIDPKLNPKNRIFSDDIYSPRVPRPTTNKDILATELSNNKEVKKLLDEKGISISRTLDAESSSPRNILMQMEGRDDLFTDEQRSMLEKAVETAFNKSQVVLVKDIDPSLQKIINGNPMLRKFAKDANDYDDFYNSALSEYDTYNYLMKKLGVDDEGLYQKLEEIRPLFEKELPLTADNYLKLLEQKLRGQDIRVQEGGFSDGAPLTARLSTEFKSIEDVKAGANRLVGVDAEKAAKEKLVEDTYAMAEKMGFGNLGNDSYDASTRLNWFVDELKGNLEADNIISTANRMKAERYSVPEFNEKEAKELSKFLKDVRDNSQSYYFEAKPMRVVPTSEVKGVLVPKGQYEWLANQLAGSDLEKKLIKYESGPTPEIRTKNRMEAWKKLIERDPNAFFGMAAGFEPEIDENGNIVGFNYDPAKAGAGFVAGTVLSSKGGRELMENLLKMAKGAKSVDEFKAAAKPLLETTEEIFNNVAVPLARTGNTKGQPTQAGMKELYNMMKAKGFQKDKGAMSYVLSQLNGDARAFSEFEGMLGKKASSKQWRALFALSKNRNQIDPEGFTRVYAALSGQKPAKVTRMIEDAPDLDQVWNQARQAVPEQTPTQAVRTGDPEIDSVIAQAEKDAGFFSDGSPVPTSEFDNAGAMIDDAPVPMEQAAEQMQKGKLGFVETVEQAEKTPDALREAFNRMDTSYSEITNKETMEAAVKRVAADYEGALARVKGPGQQTADTVAEGLLLMDDLVGKGKYDEAAEIAENMARKAKDYGQANQALAMYSRLTPTGALRWAERTAERVNANIKNPAKHIKLSTAQREGIVKQAEKIQEISSQRTALEQVVNELRTNADSLDDAGLKTLREQVEDLNKVTREKQVQTAKLVDDVARIVPPTLGQKFADFQTMAQLLNPKTAIRNIIGNVSFAGAEQVSDVVAAGIDLLMSAKSGIRTKVVPSIRVQAQGAKQGWKLGLEDALKGVDTANYSTQFDLPKTPSFRGKAGEFFNTLLNIELKATDRAFYSAAYTGSVENQLRASGDKTLLQKWNKALREEGFQNADKIVPDSIKERAHFDGLYRTFQDTNALSTAFQNVKKVLNLNQDFGYGDIVMKYPKTPANIIMRGMAYTPAGMVNAFVTLARSAAEDPRIRQRAFSEQMARALVGTGAIATGYVLAKNGIVTGKGDSDKDIEAVKAGSGGGKFRINLDALKRYVASGFNGEAAKAQQGDQIMNYDWLQPSAIQLSIGANMAETAKEGIGKATGAATTFIDSAIAGADTLAEQPLMRGIRSVFGGYSSPVEALVNPLKDAPASFVPGVSNQIRQLTDNTARSTYDPSFLGEAGRKVLNRIPGASTMLEPQVTVWGDDREVYQDGGNGLFNVFLNPAYSGKLNLTPEAQMVLDLYEATGETKQAPALAKKKYKINGENKQLTPEELTQFQRYTGKKAKAIFNALAENPNFQLLSEEAQVKTLSSYLTDIGSAAKIVVLGNEPTKIDKGVFEILAMDDNADFLRGDGTVGTIPSSSGGGTVSSGRVRGGKIRKTSLSIPSGASQKTVTLELPSAPQKRGPVFKLSKKNSL